MHLLLKTDLVADDLREFLKNLLVLDEQRFDEFKVAFDTAETLAVLIEVGDKLRLVLDEACKSVRQIAVVRISCSRWHDVSIHCTRCRPVCGARRDAKSSQQC